MMKISRSTGQKVNIMINGNRIEQAQSFKYFGNIRQKIADREFKEDSQEENSEDFGMDYAIVWT
jgi:hypothetical protein